MVLVVFALPEEARVLQKRLVQKTKRGGCLTGTIGGVRIGICFVGIRATAIANLEAAIQEFEPVLIISSGFAGGTRALLEPGDFVVASNYTTASVNLPLGTIIDSVGPFHSVQQVHGPAEKRMLGISGIAVDMESAAIASVCDRHRLPLITARMISDGRDETIPAIFTGGKVRDLRGAVEVGRFALQMLHLTRLLADQLMRLIFFVAQTKA
jgi:nucleoside phosphorylase